MIRKVGGRSLLGSLIASVALDLTARDVSAGKLNAVADLRYMMKEVGGDHVSVKTLVGLNRDVHEFEPSPDDANTLTVADIAFVSGEGLER